ncbi:MAG: hypothetical protein IKQ17_02715 [Kiritimatiellae bacterium]|nr:hypothetical protein [Kiritimatiellia bacterium]
MKGLVVSDGKLWVLGVEGRNVGREISRLDLKPQFATSNPQTPMRLIGT